MKSHALYLDDNIIKDTGGFLVLKDGNAFSWDMSGEGACDFNPLSLFRSFLTNRKIQY